MKKLPKEILVYQDTELEDGTPIYTSVSTVEQIPEDAHGKKVGVYILNSEGTFKIRRELK